MFEFHISRYARDKYEFDESIFQFNGNAILADFIAARNFAHKINLKRNLIRFPEQAVQAGEINAMGLIDEMLHAIIKAYKSQVNPNVIKNTLRHIELELGKDAVDHLLEQFSRQFPPVAVYRDDLTTSEYLSGSTDGISHREITFEEMLMLWLSNTNPALKRFNELFDDKFLQNESAYKQIIHKIDIFFQSEPGFGAGNRSLLDVLREPARKHPDSLIAQLEFLLSNYASLLSQFNFRILRSLDLLREEQKPGFSGPGPAQIPDYLQSAHEEELEKYSPDSEWMPRLVLIAKNTYVWLDQLSKKYQQDIRRLDQIPEEELEELVQRGFSGLWLIGLWERSEASQTIKHLTGNQDAVSSAYSLFDYTIAEDLGGDHAYTVLRDRAWAKGLRLAADMVPNHTGIFSKWVIERPEWFINVDYPPFPSYTFNGTNLSSDQNVGIYLEDHYYERSDAAVVFKRIDFNSGRTHYIYHGNDGTSMPWNDTAQLNYLNPEVREAVIQKIINVARKFPIIRFDAAMTLAKKHIQRLWFPEPGHGGAIPSRAEHSMPKMRLDEFMPNEFWREVVDRIAVEVPDTLLLAEAFWMMEGYFVRTLGMHRVYNSAFMNMLRDEKNGEYRQVIKNTIEFDPEILKRYVNFMNNPDEETAIEQFGDGGKYFGVCILMCTLPGLPMFGHGQVEGLHEKYGMEYQRAYYDEHPNQDLIERHEREIFPLMHLRHIFANVENFLLYDLKNEQGEASEDVFAYSNKLGSEASLVLFNNKWGTASGSLRVSSPYAVKAVDGSTNQATRTLGEGLGLPNDSSKYVIYRDHITGLEYIQSCEDIHRNGLKVELGAFEYRVLLDFRIVDENEWSHYRMILDYLDGRGVHDLEGVKQEVILEPVLQPWKELMNPGFFNWVFETSTAADPEMMTEMANQTISKMKAIVSGISQHLQIKPAIKKLPETITKEMIESVQVMEQMPRNADRALWLTWILANQLGRIRSNENYAQQSRAWIDEWLFGKVIARNLSNFDPEPYTYRLALLLIGKSPSSWIGPDALTTLKMWLSDADIAQFLGVNRHQDVLWYDRDALERLLFWVGRIQKGTSEESPDSIEQDPPISILEDIREASLISGYMVEPLIDGLTLK